MIEELQHYLHEVTRGIINTKNEAIYIITIIPLTVILIISLIVHASLT